MNEKKLPTINLKGKEYVQVKDRVVYFNDTFPNGMIVTEVKHNDNGSYAWFKALVTPDHTQPQRVFIAHSAGPVDEEKSYEKLETVAVGRALAFMGIGVLESVASADEMQKFNKKAPAKQTTSELKPCDKCGSNFILRNSTKGKFYGCSNYPNCKRTMTIEDAEMWRKDTVAMAKEVFDGEVVPTPEPPPFE